MISTFLRRDVNCITNSIIRYLYFDNYASNKIYTSLGSHDNNTQYTLCRICIESRESDDFP